MATIVPALPHLTEFLTESLATAPHLAGLLALLQLTSIWDIDVLGIYIVFMMLTPAALVALNKGYLRALIACSVAC
jgi:hypothetical protein